MGCVYTTAFRRFNSSKPDGNDVAVPVQIVARHEAHASALSVSNAYSISFRLSSMVAAGAARTTRSARIITDHFRAVSFISRPWRLVSSGSDHAPGVVAESMHVCVPCLSISSTTLAGE